MYVVFDIGGTKLRLAYSSDGESFEDPLIIQTPVVFEDALKAIKEGVEKITKGRKISKAAGGVRGVLDKDKKILLNDPHLTGWIEKPLKKSLQDIFGADTFIEHDVSMVGLGEAAYGAGKDNPIVAYMTVSTGVGGARIVDKKIDASLARSEIGHQVIDADASICPDCGSSLDGPGALESLVSGTSFEKCFGKKPHEVETNDPIWDELSKLVAVGINNTVVYWVPDVVILGGGMMKSSGISVDRVKMHLANLLKIFPTIPEIKKAELGDFGGLHGSLYYIKQH